jgi:hypothetical protein
MKLKDRCLTNKPAVEEPDRAVDLHRRTVHPEDACVHPEELVSLIVRKATEKEDGLEYDMGCSGLGGVPASAEPSGPFGRNSIRSPARDQVEALRELTSW